MLRLKKFQQMTFLNKNEDFLYHIGRNKIKNQIYIEDESVSLYAQLFIDENKNTL